MAAGSQTWPLRPMGVSRVKVPQSFPRAGQGGNGEQVS